MYTRLLVSESVWHVAIWLKQLRCVTFDGSGETDSIYHIAAVGLLYGSGAFCLTAFCFYPRENYLSESETRWLQHREPQQQRRALEEQKGQSADPTFLIA